MKIIALLPVKNESWILKTSLSSVRRLVDEIIIINDNSTDDSKKIAEDFGAQVYDNEHKSIFFSEFEVREKLLEMGRLHGGTHFIFLDADEAFSSNIDSVKFKGIVSLMKPGQKLFLRWIPLWKSIYEYRQDKRGVLGPIYKDIVFCDDKTSHHLHAFSNFPRTPGTNEPQNRNYFDEKDGVLLHFQYVPWQRTTYKQAWYRCSELLNGERSAKRINATHRYLLNKNQGTILDAPNYWIDNLEIFSDLEERSGYRWFHDNINRLFDQYGIRKFEPLEIWHIESLKERFLKEVGREPVPEVFPKILLRINDVKNWIKNNVMKK